MYDKTITSYVLFARTDISAKDIIKQIGIYSLIGIAVSVPEILIYKLMNKYRGKLPFLKKKIRKYHTNVCWVI